MLRLTIPFCLALCYGTGVRAQNETPPPRAETTATGNQQPANQLLYRNIGPFRGGRSVCATGVPGDPLTYYMGTTGGGLWKTEDAGHHWRNVTDGQVATGSVGAVAVAPSNPQIVYLGMGEHAPRGVMTSHGDGLYKSTDGGKTWHHLGLRETQHVSRIRIHPDDPDIVYVAAQGQLYGPNPERGVYRSTDGGENWERVLFVNELTGAVELSMNMSNPRELYAGMWHHQRLPWQVVSGGPGSGLYKSTDGGDTWTELTEGLPDEKGKMAVSIAQSEPHKVYLLLESDSEADKGGLFFSADAGATWTRVSDDNRLTQRAWYYTEVFADPTNPNVVYVLSAPALRSIDGGKNWERLSGTHGDHHDLWINPDNPRNLCIANDGGAAISFDYGEHWSPQDAMPTGQFYRISVDNHFPYRIYGGQQDNTSVRIAHRSFGRGGIDETDWTASAGGESAFLAFDPDDARYVMGGSYLGTIELLDMEAGTGTNIMAAPIQYLGRAASDMKYRFNWNAPIIRSRHEPDTYYHAAQVLLRTRDRGQTWEEVSPDLTYDQKDRQIKGGGPYTVEAVGAENYGTISYVVESPHEAGVIWVGTDDGKVQLTRDNAETWQDVSPRRTPPSGAGGAAPGGDFLVNAIDVSPHDPATAYVATTRYRFNDHTPRLLKTDDYGRTWTDITGDMPMGAYTRVVREDTERPDMLFAGTELGIYLSRDGGGSWRPFNLNLPVTPITDLLVAHDDLIVATSGRSFWVLDDLEFLRQYDPGDEAPQLYQPAPVVLTESSSPLDGDISDFDGTDLTEGVNPASGMVIYYMVEEQADRLEIFGGDGALVRSFSSTKDESFQSYPGGPPAPQALPAEPGLNRFVWDLRHEALKGAPTAYIEGSFRGHRVPPGEYTLRLHVNGDSLQTTATVLPNPTYDFTPEQYATYDKFMREGEATFNEIHQLVNELSRVRERLNEVMPRVKDPALCEDLNQLRDSLLVWDGEMIQRKSKAYDDVENFENKFTANYLFVLNQANSGLPRVTEPVRARKEELDAEWQRLRAQGQQVQIAVRRMNEKLYAQGVGAL